MICDLTCDSFNSSEHLFFRLLTDHWHSLVLSHFWRVAVSIRPGRHSRQVHQILVTPFSQSIVSTLFLQSEILSGCSRLAALVVSYGCRSWLHICCSCLVHCRQHCPLLLLFLLHCLLFLFYCFLLRIGQNIIHHVPLRRFCIPVHANDRGKSSSCSGTKITPSGSFCWESRHSTNNKNRTKTLTLFLLPPTAAAAAVGELLLAAACCSWSKTRMELIIDSF
jgi:hypothetical protein